jgi:hypothetical protein
MGFPFSDDYLTERDDMQRAADNITRQLDINGGENITSSDHAFLVVPSDEGVVIALAVPGLMTFSDSLYYDWYDQVSTAARPYYSVELPEAKQVVDTSDLGDPFNAGGFYYPWHKGLPKRLYASDDELFSVFEETGELPIMPDLRYSFELAPTALISGASGSGKTTFVNTIARILSRKYPGHVTIVDPKVADFARSWRNEPNVNLVLPPASDRSEEFVPDVTKMLRGFEAEAMRRQWEMLKSGRENVKYSELGFEPEFIILDEIASMVTGIDNKIRKAFMDSLARLAARARSGGVFLFLISQSFDANTLDTSVRRNAGMKVIISQDLSSDNTQFLFSDLKSLPLLPQDKMPKGRGLLVINDGRASNMGVRGLLTPFVEGL